MYRRVHHVCNYLWCLTLGVILVSQQHNPTKKLPSSGQIAPILILPCRRGLREFPPSCTCISVLAMQNCRDNGLKHVHTLKTHVHTMYIQVHTLYMGTTYCMHVPLWYMAFAILQKNCMFMVTSMNRNETCTAH
jgi:hypothetical protein